MTTCRGSSFGFAAGVLLIATFSWADPPSALPTSSSPIAITRNDREVWVVNPDNDSVTVFAVDAGHTSLTKVGEIAVGDEPRSLAVTRNGAKVYVTNQGSGTVSVIHAHRQEVDKTIAVGTEPFGCALTPDGKKLYVTNLSSNTVSVIRTNQDNVVGTIAVGPQPAAIAITGSSHSEAAKVYVTHFLALLRDDDRTVVEKEGRDDGKDGRVTVIAAHSDEVLGTVVLNPLADSGFNSNGSVLDRIAPVDPPMFTFTTGAFPNLLHSVVIKGGRAYLPNTASSPNGPVRFNVNVQSFLSVFDVESDEDSGQTINMNRGVQLEPPGTKLFITNPIAVAFKQGADEGFVVSAATDRLVRVVLDANGTPTINAPAMMGDPGNVIRIPVGKNPQGLVLNSDDTRAYVFNFISRDVSVVDISGDPSAYQEISRAASVSLPTPGSLDAIVHRGHELFNTSIGPEGTNENALAPAGRMSDFGWGSCYGCHPRGLTDGVTWMFGDGPRQTISMESTAEHPQPPGAMLNANGAPLLPSFKQRVLNWSAVRDEIQDFELNIRGVSGGQGLIRDASAAMVFNLTPTANTGRDADLDAIAAYIAFGIRAPISPSRGENVAQGRNLFAAANCQSCHGGANWTRSQVDFTPPPDPMVETITAGQLVRFLVVGGTFDQAVFNEVRPMGTSIAVANGALGFNIPSLLSVFAGAPYFHNGSAQTLDDVLANVTHRSAGTGGVDTLTNPQDRAELVRFLESIDATTPHFP